MRNLPATSQGGGGHRYPPPLIKLADRCDIPAVAKVIIDALSRDLISFYAAPTEEDKRQLFLQMTQDLEKVWDDKRLRCVKAVDIETGEIAAVGAWVLKGYKFKEEERISELQPSLHALRLPSSSRDGRENPAQKLADYISDQFDEFFASWTDNTKHMYLAILMTAQRFQRRGYGTALLNWGHKFADNEGIPLVLIASPVGHPLYLHLGWKEIYQNLEIDMSKWVEGAGGRDQGWGTYTYYPMMRMPMTAEK